MPSKYYKKDANNNPTIEIFCELAEKYYTSLISTSIWFIEKTNHIGAIILSKNGKIIWGIKSENFNYYIRGKGDPIDERSLTYDCIEFKEDDSLGPDEVSPEAWVDDEIDEGEKMYEQVLYFNKLDQYITLITIEENF